MFEPQARPRVIRPAAYDHIGVKPLSGLIGAEIDGVDLCALSSEQVEEVKRAFAEHLVVVFRGQERLTRDKHIAFAKLFGSIGKIPHLKCASDYPDVQFIHRNADDKGQVIGEALHCDSTFLKAPPRAVVMRATTVPPFGGDTAFSNLYLAYETLSPGMQTLVDSLQVIHSARRLFGSGADTTRFAMHEVAASEGDVEVAHPLAITHPVTGRKAIFLNPLFSLRFRDMTEAESRPILDYILRHGEFIPLTVRVRWEVGTVVVWDNLAAAHSAVGDYEGFERTLERVTVAGAALH
jgi:alpha-ketoglutarate-dependent taurine dioxygenase